MELEGRKKARGLSAGPTCDDDIIFSSLSLNLIFSNVLQSGVVEFIGNNSSIPVLIPPCRKVGGKLVGSGGR